MRDMANRAQVAGYTLDVLKSANEGKTSHLVEGVKVTVVRLSPFRPGGIPPPYQITSDSVSLFQRIFPDCTVTYVEDWFDTKPGVKEFKKGILIDWS